MEMAGQPIGMFHCPECGEMVIAGIPHPDYSILDEDCPDDTPGHAGRGEAGETQ
jgi:acetone carboxylase gamma subunit